MNKIIMVFITLGLFGTAYAGSEDPTDGEVILSSENRTGSQPEIGSSSFTNIFAGATFSGSYDNEDDLH